MRSRIGAITFIFLNVSLLAADPPSPAKLRTGPFSVAIDEQGLARELHQPDGKTLPAIAGTAEVRYGTLRRPLNQPAEVNRAADRVTVKYRLPGEPEIHVDVTYRLQADRDVVVLAREVEVRASARLKEDLAVALVRQIARRMEMHDPPVAFLTSDCMELSGTANYALVAHGTYQDTWCDPRAWPYGIFPNWRNTRWSCCWWPVHKWKWVEFGVRQYQAPVAISNGFGDNTGFSEMSPEMQEKVLDLFRWRAQFRAQMKVMEPLPVYE